MTWGAADAGGDSSLLRSELRGVKHLAASQRAFAAILEDGGVVTWGNPEYGGADLDGANFMGQEALNRVSSKTFQVFWRQGHKLLEGTCHTHHPRGVCLGPTEETLNHPMGVLAVQSGQSGVGQDGPGRGFFTKICRCWKLEVVGVDQTNLQTPNCIVRSPVFGVVDSLLLSDTDTCLDGEDPGSWSIFGRFGCECHDRRANRLCWKVQQL